MNTKAYVALSDDVQVQVKDWITGMLGEITFKSHRERALRFIEEAIELAQACGLERQDVAYTIEYVYDKPPGNVAQEIGGVHSTVLCLSQAFGLSFAGEGSKELKRCIANTDAIREKHSRKKLKG